MRFRKRQIPNGTVRVFCVNEVAVKLVPGDILSDAKGCRDRNKEKRSEKMSKGLQKSPFEASEWWNEAGENYTEACAESTKSLHSNWPLRTLFVRPRHL